MKNNTLNFIKYDSNPDKIFYVAKATETIVPTLNIVYDFDFVIFVSGNDFTVFIDVKSKDKKAAAHRVIQGCGSLYEAEFMATVYYNYMINAFVESSKNIVNEYKDYINSIDDEEAKKAVAEANPYADLEKLIDEKFDKRMNEFGKELKAYKEKRYAEAKTEE